MMIICTNLFSNPSMHDQVMVLNEQASLKPMHNAKEWTMNLTYNLATWFLFVTHPLIMISILLIYHLNPTTHDKIIIAGHEQVSLKPMHKV